MAVASPIVLLHGVGLDRTIWDDVAGLLPGRVVAIDLPGHGGRPPLRSAQSLATLAEDVLDRMPTEPVHLVGFSLGSLIAQHIARHEPGIVRTLTCVSSVCDRTVAERDAVEGRLTAATEDFAASAAASIARWYPAGTSVSPRVVEATREVLLRNDVESFLHAYAVFARGDAEIAPELGRITCPTFAITGELDSGSTPAMSARLAAAIPDCRIEIVRGTRHMLPAERPDRLGAAIGAFITHAEGIAA